MIHSFGCTRRVALAAIVLAGPALLSGCGSDADTASDTTTSTTAMAAMGESSATDAATIAVEGAWARTSPAMTTAGAMYAVISNDSDTDDAVIGVAVDASIAARAELHNTTMDDSATSAPMGSDSMGSGSMGSDGAGMMKMAPVDSIEIPAGESVELKPGGYHIMLMDLAEPLTAGDEISVTLTLRNAGEVVVKAPVRDTAP